MSPYVPPYWSFAPFVSILLAIAVLPLLPRVEHWWHRNGNKLLISMILALATLAFYAFAHEGLAVEATPGHPAGTLTGGALVFHVLEHAIGSEFIPFIVLLFSLYTISGGILISGDIEARPRINCAFIGVGAMLASFIGTTGASMLLIRPLLRTNAERRRKIHTVLFFIFIVSNIGGSLTPLGDPPLFLGFLRGVPFWWPMEHLFFPWLLACTTLLLIYAVWDTIAYRAESKKAIAEDVIHVRPLRCRGGVNFFWLFLVIACVALVDPHREVPGLGWKPFPLARELLLLVVTALSWMTTRDNREIRARNDFNFFAITEVACLFIGIFICMQPAIEFLNLKGDALGLTTPVQFFWATGIFSSCLDNAPTYVVFFETAKALTAAGTSGFVEVVEVAGGAVAQELLLGVSLGAVFLGANTYIGNAPNFMVKSIAETSGVKMPSFFGYMVIAAIILLPVFLVVTVVFLS